MEAVGSAVRSDRIRRPGGPDRVREPRDGDRERELGDGAGKAPSASGVRIAAPIGAERPEMTVPPRIAAVRHVRGKSSPDPVSWVTSDPIPRAGNISGGQG